MSSGGVAGVLIIIPVEVFGGVGEDFLMIGADDIGFVSADDPPFPP